MHHGVAYTFIISHYLPDEHLDLALPHPGVERVQQAVARTGGSVLGDYPALSRIRAPRFAGMEHLLVVVETKR
jgi:hypothetical protein